MQWLKNCGYLKLWGFKEGGYILRGGGGICVSTCSCTNYHVNKCICLYICIYIGVCMYIYIGVCMYVCAYDSSIKAMIVRSGIKHIYSTKKIVHKLFCTNLMN